MKFACKYSSRLIYNIVFKNLLQLHNSNSIQPINLCYKINSLLVKLPLRFFPIKKNSQALFSVALTEATRQEPVLFQNEVMCICVLTVTVLSRNFQATEILPISSLFPASPLFPHNKTPSVRVSLKKSNLHITSVPLRTMVVCCKMWQAHAKTKGHSLHGTSPTVPYWANVPPSPYRFLMVNRDATSGQSSFSTESQLPEMCNHLHPCKVDVNSLCTHFAQVKMTAQRERQWRIKLLMTAKCLSRVWWRPTEAQWSVGKQMSAAVWGVYFPSLCQQCLLFAEEFTRVCPADNKSTAVWMQQACLLQLSLALLWGSSCSRKPVLPPGLEDVWLWDQFMGESS